MNQCHYIIQFIDLLVKNNFIYNIINNVITRIIVYLINVNNNIQLVKHYNYNH